MDNPEFSHSPEATKEEAYKILLREIENGFALQSLRAKGIFDSHKVKEVSEYVRDEVVDDIARSAVDFNAFCNGMNYRFKIYKNKVDDFYRRGLSPFVDVSESDDKITDAPGAQTRAKKTINKLSMDSGNFLQRLEAVDELSDVIQRIKDETHRRRLEVIFKGASLGWTNSEVIDELERLEGKRMTESGVSQTYRHLRDRYLKKRFPQASKTLDQLRRLTEPTKYEVRETRASSVTEYAALLSEDVRRLSEEEQTPQTKEEILIIEYLLGKRQIASLSEMGLTTRKIMMIKKRIASRLSVPIDFLDRRIDGLSKI